MQTLRDRLWLWGQEPGSHHAVENNAYHLPGVNRMDSAAGAAYLGIPNCCRVVMGNEPRPPFDEHTRALAALHEVVWSIVGSGGSTRNDDGGADIDEVLRQARRFPNVSGAMLDDFFAATGPRYSADELTAFRQRLRGEAPRPLDLWVVWYEHQLQRNDISECLAVCDVITFWTWRGENLAHLEDNLATVRRATPGKRLLAGCYMWDYGNCRPLPPGAMQAQCETYLEHMLRGDLDGMIVCSNCIADIGLDTTEWLRQWICDVGDTPC